MASRARPCLRLLFLLSLLSASSFLAAASSSPFSSSSAAEGLLRRRRLLQSSSARNPNIETFFPPNAVPAFSNPPAPPPPLPSVPTFAPRRSSSKASIAGAVVATAASTFVVSGLFFFALHRFVFKRRRAENDYNQGNKVRGEGGGGGGTAARRNPYRRRPVNGLLKAVVVDEDGLDVLYWRKLEDGDRKRCAHCRQVIGGGAEAAGGGEGGRNGSERSRLHREDKRPVQEAPLLMADSLSSSDRMTAVVEMLEDRSSVSSVSASTRASVEAVAVASSPPSLPLPPGRRTPSPASSSSSLPPPPAAARPSSPPSVTAVAPPPKPPSAPPPPPPPAAAKSVPAPPAPPPPRPSTGGNKPPGPPAPPPAPGGARSGPFPFRPPGIPRSNSKSTGGDRPSEESTKAPAKLKPLHWDKMNTVNAQHSMIWDKIGGGSFRVDDDMMEVLFGYVAGRKSPKNSSSASENPFSSVAGGAPTQICLLDPRKSQNTAIVLKSLAVTRREILDALVDGRGLGFDTLEKLSKLAPSKEEEDTIVRFSGNPSSLADAECFLFHLLRDVPSAFARVDTMLFKASYEPEVLHLRAALQSLEAACEELRRRGLFWKMLEAVLKAGNRMNAGTARGNAQAFNLTSLRKLSDVRSTDGKTTLLHFVVESVVRNEGKRCVVNRNHSFGRSASRSAAGGGGGFSSSSSPAPGAAPTRGEKEMEYMTLGLPVVGGLSVEFANVKKAAGIDHDALSSTCPALDARAARARRVVAACGGDGGGFAGEIGGFLERAEEELKGLREEQARILELVKKTTEYYMLGAAQDKSASPLQLFVIVKDFLVMVDQACVDIARNVQQQKRKAAMAGTASPKTPEKRAPTRFANLPERFMSENSRSSSSGDSGSNSDSEEEGL